MVDDETPEVEPVVTPERSSFSLTRACWGVESSAREDLLKKENSVFWEDPGRDLGRDISGKLMLLMLSRVS